ALTRSLDPSRPVVSNDGYELTGGDIIALHDYTTDADRLAAHYADEEATAETIAGRGPQRRRPIDDAAQHVNPDAPVMITEFGGIAYAAEGTWGYATVSEPEEFRAKVGGLFAALNASPTLAGHCYTQLTDTLDEANGLATAVRLTQLESTVIRALVTGRGRDERCRRRVGSALVAPVRRAVAARADPTVVDTAVGPDGDRVP